MWLKELLRNGTAFVRELRVYLPDIILESDGLGRFYLTFPLDDLDAQIEVTVFDGQITDLVIGKLLIVRDKDISSGYAVLGKVEEAPRDGFFGEVKFRRVGKDKLEKEIQGFELPRDYLRDVFIFPIKLDELCSLYQKFLYYVRERIQCNERLVVTEMKYHFLGVKELAEAGSRS